MELLQIVFFLGGAIVLWLALRMRRLNRIQPLPGVSWWVAGYLCVGLASIGSGADLYLGDWIKGVVTHMLLTGGVALVWIGSRLFLDGRAGPLLVSAVGMLLAFEAAGIIWFYFVESVYQVRLTITCVVLLILSMGQSMNLFLARFDDRAIIAAGACYCLFALLNGLRTVTILLNPVPTYYLSGPLAATATMLMLPALISAEIANLRMIRDVEGAKPDNPA